MRRPTSSWRRSPRRGASTARTRRSGRLITADDGQSITPLLQQLRDATTAIDAPFLRSAFVGNAGIVSFSDGTTIAVKAETHNHPSAIEPFGGANTGVGGVIRDVMGAAHRPIAVTDILCFGPTDLAADELPDGVLHPRLIEAGVVAGVADYGNKIGLPTVAGAVLYDPGYIANPLVYCGCIGIADDTPPLTGPHPGDLVVVLGGRTGRDGLRGATFSSATMDATTGDVAGASVQIGDPIIEKLLIDVLRDATGLVLGDHRLRRRRVVVGDRRDGRGRRRRRRPRRRAAEVPGPAPVGDLAQRGAGAHGRRRRRESAWLQLQQLCDRHGVEATALGTFTGDGVLRVRHGETTVLELDTDVPPRRPAAAQRWKRCCPHPIGASADPPSCTDVAATLLALLRHPNIASKESVIRRYDHEILGSTVVRPLVGRRRDGHADGVVLADPADTHGIAIGIGVNPWYGELDPERMAHAVVDEAIRNVVAVGADPDNGRAARQLLVGRPAPAVDARRARRGGARVLRRVAGPQRAVRQRQGLAEQRVPRRRRRAPHRAADARDHRRSPTCPTPNAVVTPDLKHAGNVVVLVGRTACEFGGSHFAQGPRRRPVGQRCLRPIPPRPPAIAACTRRCASGRVLACHDISEGGLAVALAEMAIGGRLGLSIDTLAGPDPDRRAVQRDHRPVRLRGRAGRRRMAGEQLGEPVTSSAPSPTSRRCASARRDPDPARRASSTRSERDR